MDVDVGGGSSVGGRRQNASNGFVSPLALARAVRSGLIRPKEVENCFANPPQKSRPHHRSQETVLISANKDRNFDILLRVRLWGEYPGAKFPSDKFMAGFPSA